MAPHFSFLPGPMEAWAAIGFLTRPAALSLLVTMMSAVYFHLSTVGAQGFPLGHVSNYSYDFEEPLLYSLIFLMFWFNGAGPLSVDSIIYKSISKEQEDGGEN
jgi:putative oxidoreductase